MLFAALVLLLPFPQAGDLLKVAPDAPVVMASNLADDSASIQPSAAAPNAITDSVPAAPAPKVAPAIVTGAAPKIAPDATPAGEPAAPAQKIIPRSTPLPPMPAGKGALYGSYESSRQRKEWSGLMIAGHSAAVFDAWSTRRAISGGYGTESNPLLRPFSHSNAIYAATQVSPAVMDYLGRRMMMSQRGWVRRMWWMPQAVGASFSISAGVHNTRLVP
jgi:hypothetical protein